MRASIKEQADDESIQCYNIEKDLGFKLNKVKNGSLSPKNTNVQMLSSGVFIRNISHKKVEMLRKSSARKLRRSASGSLEAKDPLKERSTVKKEKRHKGRPVVPRLSQQKFVIPHLAKKYGFN